jgi:hypothetical protein
MVQKEYLRTQKKPRDRFPSHQKEELWIAAAALFLQMFFSCQWQRGQMNSNEGGYTAMWQQQRRDTMAKSFCPMKTDYKLLSCIEYLMTKETP